MKQMSGEITVVFLCFRQNLQVDWQPIKNPSEANRVQHFPTRWCNKLELCSIVIKFEQLSLFFLTETRETFGSICSFLLNGWACLATWERRMKIAFMSVGWVKIEKSWRREVIEFTQKSFNSYSDCRDGVFHSDSHLSHALGSFF